jgi:hypothetical protein
MSMYADQHRHVTLKTTESNHVYYAFRGATVGNRGSMAWMPAYIAVPNLLSMISMLPAMPHSVESSLIREYLCEIELKFKNILGC